jgi:hypothetical protein
MAKPLSYMLKMAFSPKRLSNKSCGGSWPAEFYSANPT